MSKFSYTRLVADMSDLYKRLLKSTWFLIFKDKY
jgi:hypothetical protein